MPYIKKERKHEISIPPEFPFNATAGDLNYVLTKIIIEYLSIKPLNYQTCNDIVGALDNCKDEFKRRIQDPYEDLKIKENGDVYPEEFLNGGTK
jgi:hypothetical protein